MIYKKLTGSYYLDDSHVLGPQLCILATINLLYYLGESSMVVRATDLFFFGTTDYLVVVNLVVT